MKNSNQSNKHQNKNKTLQRKSIYKSHKPEKIVLKPKKLRTDKMQLKKKVSENLRPEKKKPEKKNDLFETEIPFSEGSLIKNIVKCKYFAKGSCLFGQNCRFSHNFYEDTYNRVKSQQDMEIERPKFAVNIDRAYYFDISNALSEHNHIDQLNCSVHRMSDKSKFISVSGYMPIKSLSTLWGYREGCMRYITKSRFKGQIHDVLMLEKSLFSSPLLSKGLVFILTAKFLFVVSKQILKPLRRIRIPDLEKEARIRQIQLGVSVKKQKLNKDALLIVTQGGRVIMLSYPKLEVLVNVNIGVSIYDYDLLTLPKSDVNLQLWKNNTMAVGGKGIKLLDLNTLKIFNQFSYNQYTIYCCVKAFPLDKKSVETAVITCGRLSDSIIAFSSQLFVEIWNPVTGGILKRLSGIGVSQEHLSFCSAEMRLLKYRDAAVCTHILLRTLDYTGVINLDDETSRETIVEKSSHDLALGYQEETNEYRGTVLISSNQCLIAQDFSATAL